VTLLGQNVTAYRWRDELDFAGLLRRIAQLSGLRRIRFLTGHPRDVSEPLLNVMATEAKVCPALHVPMQSGSDHILKRMKRLYRRQEYLEMVERARRMIPHLTFSSDFIVGFPGETEDDFNATLEVVRQVAYDQVFAFKYSARPDTPAARLPDDVPLPEKKRRLAQLLDLQAEVWQSIAAAQIGQVWQVAVEAPARRPAEVWKTRTANNRKVLVRLPKARPGQELSVRIMGYQNTTFRGEPLNPAR
jgi:tRNA-2-methylthio-N6-dimethylallyladenosine synthase